MSWDMCQRWYQESSPCARPQVRTCTCSFSLNYQKMPNKTDILAPFPDEKMEAHVLIECLISWKRQDLSDLKAHALAHDCPPVIHTHIHTHTPTTNNEQRSSSQKRKDLRLEKVLTLLSEWRALPPPTWYYRNGSSAQGPSPPTGPGGQMSK